ncbi:MAG: twitch domain-containing radical SAM protein [Bacteroidota bacterium]
MDQSHQELFSDGRAFCIMPWVHLHVTTRGQVQACCVGNIPFGNVNTAGIGEIWQGKAIREFRRKLLRDEPDPRCRVCYAREEAGAISLRQETNARFRHHFPAVAGTTPDGTAPAAQPAYWDIRFSNLCNFRCRTCWHGASSRWFEEAQALGNAAGPAAVIRAAEDDAAFTQQLALLLPHTEEIYFAGGEPLLMPEHFRLLAGLIAAGHTGVRLRYNTNFSRLDYGGHDLAALWAEFDSVSIGASLDLAGHRGEFLRKGQRWTQVEANRLRLQEQCPRVQFAWHPTVSVFNVLHLPAFHRDWVERGWLEREAVFLNLLERPAHFNLKVLPPELKAEVRQRFAEHLDWLGEAAESVAAQFRGVQAFMDQAQWQSKLPKFRAACARLDALRGENTRAVFPELRTLWPA